VEGITVLEGEIIAKELKYNENFYKIFFSITSRPKSIKLGTNYPWMKGIQVCSNKGPDPLQKGDNHPNIEMGLVHLIIFFRTTGPILTRLRIIHLWGKGIQVCSNEGDCPSPRGGNSKRVRIH
jgi:hypothetical protein